MSTHPEADPEAPDPEAVGSAAPGAESELEALRPEAPAPDEAEIRPPEPEPSGPDARRRERVLLGFGAALLLLTAEIGLFLHWRLQGGTPPVLAVGLGGSGLLFGAGFVALSRWHRTVVAANLMLAAAFATALPVLALMGGIRTHALHWVALLPVLAVLIASRRSAWGWAAVSLATIVVFAGMEMGGVAPVSPFGHAGTLLADGLWIQRLVSVSAWLGILFAIVLVYERQRDQQTAELGNTNSELTREIAHRRQAEARTHYLAYYDDLTHLPNRQLFQDRLEDAVVQAERDGRLVAVMFLDLDGFKEVNDTYGHRFGDALLQQVAERLRACVRNSDSVFQGAGEEEAYEDPIVSRLGGDEFTVLLARLRDEGEAKLVARRILTSLEQVFRVEGQEIHISVSIGIALYPGEVDEVGGLLKSADLAMYSAKARGKNNYQFFRSSMNAEVVHRTTLANELRRATERGEFVLHYQPIVEARSWRIAKVEALVRWQHPTRGLLMPAAFIHVAEQTGLIVPMADDLTERACEQTRLWLDAGLPPVTVAVNLSGVQLRHGNLACRLAEVLAATRLDPAQLEIEVTENAVMADEVEAALALNELKELGIGISLDDFGTGYSSLSYIHRYPVDLVKIDRSFVRDVVIDTDAQAITRAIVAMARGLGLEVVAEGVETEEQERFLRALGCDYLQGFRFSVPRPAHEIPELLQSGLQPKDVG